MHHKNQIIALKKIAKIAKRFPPNSLPATNGLTVETKTAKADTLAGIGNVK